jgi:hypothetical protein
MGRPSNGPSHKIHTQVPIELWNKLSIHITDPLRGTTAHGGLQRVVEQALWAWVISYEKSLPKIENKS